MARNADPRFDRWATAAFVMPLVFAFGLLAGCGGGGGGESRNPVPVVSALSPASATAGGPAFSLTVTGSGFVSGSTVLWNGADRATTFTSSTQLRAAIAAADIASAGDAQVKVRSPGPGGGTSAAAAFTVNQLPPVLSSLEPNSVASGSPSLTLTLHGSNYAAGSLARWNGQVLETTFMSAGELKAVVPAASMLTLGDVAISVANPAPGASESASLPLRVGGILRTSVSRDGSDVDGGSDISAVNADGRFVAFASGASNLVAGDTNNSYDVFVRDTCLGAPEGCVPTTQRVSVASDGSQGTANSGWTSNTPELTVAISGSGRYVAFVSVAANLVSDDMNPWEDVFVRDTCLGAPTGCVPQTTLVSAGAGGVPSSSYSTHVAISRSGRFVAFVSWAGNLVTGDTNDAYDVFVRDTCAGATASCVPSTSRASVSDAGAQADRDSLHPSFSGDERYIVFVSSATNLVAGDTNDSHDVFRRDTCFGAPTGCTPSTVRVSLTTDGLQSTGGGFFPKASLTGRYVSFVSTAADLVPGDTNTVADLFLRDTCLGIASGCSPTTSRISVSNDGLQAGGMWMPAMSDSARFAVFASSDGGYVAGDSAANWDVFLRDTCLEAPSGCTPGTRRLSVSFEGAEGNGMSTTPAVSSDGRYVTFSSGSSNLVPGGVSPTYFLNIYMTETRP